MPDDRQREDDYAALDAAQQQLRASAEATLEEHLQQVAQRHVDDELAALAASGQWSVDPSVRYEVVVRRASPI
jgi:hypothetical protein